jgi:phospholipid transport system substrate-binding protein
MLQRRAMSLILLLASSYVVATPYVAPNAVAPFSQNQTPLALQELAQPAVVLQQGIETLTGYLGQHSGPINPGQLQQWLQREIAPYFDFGRMTLWAAGALNREMSPQQRQRLEQIIANRFLTAMAQQLTSYRNAAIHYLPPRGNLLQGDVTLGVQIYTQQQPPIQIDFRLYRGEQGWRVYDVAANGASAVAFYRHEIRQQVRQLGVNGLLAMLNHQ